MRRIHRICSIPLCLLAGFLFTSCGGGDGDGNGNGNGNGDDGAGIRFTESNVRDIARVVCAGLEIFPQLSRIELAMVQADESLRPGDPRSSPRVLGDLGDIGLCTTGESILWWSDTDGDEALSAGDSLRLELIDCDDEVPRHRRGRGRFQRLGLPAHGHGRGQDHPRRHGRGRHHVLREHHLERARRLERILPG